MSSLSQQSPCHITLPLSIDVLDYILSYLESDPKTLEAFCKSHPLLSQIAEPHVYANIYLRTSDHISDHNFGPSNLAKLLSDRPHIANYIRNLDIQVSGDSDEDVGTFLHEISTVLPKLLALKKISLDHQYSILKSGSQPESFHTAFVGCLRSQSVQHVCLKGIFYFPFISAWHGKSRTIENLTLSNCLVLHKRGRTFNPYGSNLPIECGCGGNFLEKFSGLIKGVHFRSLEYSHYNYDLLPGLLSLSSNFLTSLDLDIGRKFRTFCDSKPTPSIPDPNNIIPIELSTFPYLEQLTIHCQLEYISGYDRGSLGYLSPIPAITYLLSTRTNTSSLRHVTLDLSFTCIDLSAPMFQPWLSFPEVISPPFVHLLSKVAETSGASSVPTRVCLRLNGATSRTPRTLTQTRKSILAQVILSSFAVCGELMQFVHQGLLVVTPPIPIQNASSPIDGPLTANPSESQFSMLSSSTDAHNASNSETRKLITMLWVASVQEDVVRLK